MNWTLGGFLLQVEMGWCSLVGVFPKTPICGGRGEKCPNKNPAVTEIHIVDNFENNSTRGLALTKAQLWKSQKVRLKRMSSAVTLKWREITRPATLKLKRYHFWLLKRTSFQCISFIFPKSPTRLIVLYRFQEDHVVKSKFWILCWLEVQFLRPAIRWWPVWV